MMIPKRRLLNLIFACLCFKKWLLIKNVSSSVLFHVSICTCSVIDQFVWYKVMYAHMCSVALLKFELPLDMILVSILLIWYPKTVY